MGRRDRLAQLGIGLSLRPLMCIAPYGCTPALGVTGIVFAVLLSISVYLVRDLPESTADSVTVQNWLSDSGHRTRISVATYLALFASIALLWFIGTVRRRIGVLEDRLFSTRMAALLMLSMSNLGQITNAFPTWLVRLSMVAGLVLLLSATSNAALVFVFPAWALVVSLAILRRRDRFEDQPSPGDG